MIIPTTKPVPKAEIQESEVDPVNSN